MNQKCNLLIDSCCDLPSHLIDHEGVTLLQFPYLFGDIEYRDDLYQSTTAHDFFDRIRAGEEPTTSQLSLPVLTEAFTQAAKSGVPTVYLGFGSALSGTFDTALLVHGQVCADYPDAQLYIVDTKLASIAEGLLVFEAICQRDLGLSAQEIVKWAEEARYFVHAQFMVDDLTSLERGGRIPTSVAFAGAKLDVKPLLGFAIEGDLALTGVARGRKKGIKQLADYFEKHRTEQQSDQRVVIGNADCPKDAERLKDILLKLDPSLLFLDAEIGPVIGSHVGPGMLAVVFWGTDRRETLSVSERIARKVKGK